MNKKYKIIPFLLFLIVGGILALFLFGKGHYFMSLLTLILSLISGFIFSNKNAYAFRFLYPGLITFSLFMILPIVFTVYIGFTNLSTGHYLNQSDAEQAILEERRLLPESKVFKFRLHPLGKNLNVLRVLVFLPDTTLLTIVNLDKDKQDYQLEKIQEYPKTAALSRKQVLDLHDKLKKLTFTSKLTPPLQYFRSNKLASFQRIYNKTDKANELIKYDGSKYIANFDQGNYVQSQTGERILPGFYVPVGLKNFLTLFQDESIRGPFMNILTWTFSWGFFSVLLTFLFGMTLAIILNEKSLFGKKIYRTLFVIPYSIPFFISVLIFRGMLNKDFGIINEALLALGMTTKIAWLETPMLAKVSCLLVNLWLGFPYMFLVTTGILQSIPSSIYEAAKLDGSNTWNTFRRITLPLIMQAIGPILIGSFAFNLNNFIGIYLLTGGGPPIPGSTTPAGSTDILISYTYRLAFEGGQGQNFGLASAISILIFFAIAIITYFNFQLTGMGKEEAPK